jgi:transposase InsO family protein
MGNNMGAALVDDALEMAVTRRKPGKGVIHHSDHGSQYKSLLLGRTMRRYGIVPSMGAIASPWDNAVTESLMSTIKVECIHRQTFKTRDDARLEIFDYIEAFYNKLRIHSALGILSPVEHEAMMQREAVPA